MASPKNSCLESCDIGLPLLHAGGETGKWRHGRILPDCRWAQDGAAIAPLPGMKAKSRRKTFLKRSAISGTPAVVAWSPPDRAVGRGALRRVCAPRSVPRVSSRRNCWRCPGSHPRFSITSARRITARFEHGDLGIRSIACNLAAPARRRAHSEDGGMFSGIVSEEEGLRTATPRKEDNA